MNNLEFTEITYEDKSIISHYIKQIIKYLEEKAGGKTNCRRFDPDKDDFFYFTDCNDIIPKDTDSEIVKQQKLQEMGKRKGMHFAAMLLKWFIGVEFEKPVKCSHCGFKPKIQGLLPQGHFDFCPNCEMVSYSSYPNSYDINAKAWIEIYDRCFKGKSFEERKKMIDATVKEVSIREPIKDMNNEQVDRTSEMEVQKLSDEIDVSEKLITDESVCPNCRSQICIDVDDINYKKHYKCSRCDFSRSYMFISDNVVRELLAEARTCPKCKKKDGLRYVVNEKYLLCINCDYKQCDEDDYYDS